MALCSVLFKLVILSYQVIKSMTPYFGVWLLTDFKAHRFFPPFIPFLVKLIRKPRCPSLWHQWEVKTMYRNSWPGPTPTHHKTQSLSLFSQSIFRLAWETLPTIHKKHYVWVISLFIPYWNVYVITSFSIETKFWFILLLILLQSVHNIAQFVLN